MKPVAARLFATLALCAAPALAEEPDAQQKAFAEMFAVEAGGLYDPIFGYTGRGDMYDEHAYERMTEPHDWTEPDGTEKTLRPCLWAMRGPLPFNLQFDVEIHDPATGKAFRCEPIAVRAGQTERGAFTPLEIEEFVKGHEERFGLEVRLTPNSNVAGVYQHPATFSNATFSIETHADPFPAGFRDAIAPMLDLVKRRPDIQGRFCNHYMNLLSSNPRIRRDQFRRLPEDPAAAPELIPILIRLMALPDTRETGYIAQEAACALGRLRAKETVPSILELFKCLDPLLRLRAVEASGAASTQEGAEPWALAALKESLGDPEPKIRLQAARTLGWPLYRPLAQNVLRRSARKDSDAGVRKAAVGSLEVRLDESIPVLIDALGDASPEVRQEAASGLITPHDPRKIGPLIKAAKSDPDAEVRRRAIDAMGYPKDPRAVDAMFEALGDADTKVRRSAASQLAVHGGKRALSPLFIMLADPDQGVVTAAGYALQRLTGKNHGTDAAAWARELGLEPKPTS